MRGLPYARNFERPNRAEKELHEKGRAIPERDQRANDFMAVRMENALVPAARTFRMIRIFTNGIEKGLKHANGIRLGILGHEQGMTTALLTDFVDKFGKGLCVRQVYNRAGLDAVAVPASDNELIPLCGEIDYRLVFLPTAQAA